MQLIKFLTPRKYSINYLGDITKMKTITPIVKDLLKDGKWRWGRSLSQELYNLTNQKNADRRLREMAETGFIKKKYAQPTPYSREEVMYHI